MSAPSTIPATESTTRSVRVIASRVVAALTAIAVGVGTAPALQAPWHDYVLGQPVTVPADHAWHVAITAVVDVLLAVVLAAYALRGPERQRLAVPLSAVTAVVVLVNVPFAGLGILVPAVLFGLVAVLGRASAALRLTMQQLGRDPVVTALTVGSAILGLPYAVACYARQIRGADAVAANNDYASTTEHVLLIVVALLLASSALPGHRLVVAATGAAFSYAAAAAASVSGPAAPRPAVGIALAAIAAGCLIAAARRPKAKTAESPATAGRGETFRS